MTDIGTAMTLLLNRVPQPVSPLLPKAAEVIAQWRQGVSGTPTAANLEQLVKLCLGQSDYDSVARVFIATLAFNPHGAEACYCRFSMPLCQGEGKPWPGAQYALGVVLGMFQGVN